MSCELVTSFDAKYPVPLGGLLSSEDKLGFLQVSIMEIVPTTESLLRLPDSLSERVEFIVVKSHPCSERKFFSQLLRFSKTNISTV